MTPESDRTYYLHHVRPCTAKVHRWLAWWRHTGAEAGRGRAVRGRGNRRRDAERCRCRSEPCLMLAPLRAGATAPTHAQHIHTVTISTLSILDAISDGTCSLTLETTRTVDKNDEVQG